MQIVKTFKADIYVGLKVRSNGILHCADEAKLICQEYCNESNECVSFTNTEFIYTNGSEVGVIVGFIQYPRFIRDEQMLKNRVIELAEILMIKMEQIRVSIVMQDKTIMLTNNEIKQEVCNE